MNILLICGGGSSTGFLVVAMIKAAKKLGLSVDIKARSETQLRNLISETDIVLGAPHLRINEEKYRKICKSYDVPFAFIDAEDYAMMQGEKVLNFVIKRLAS